MNSNTVEVVKVSTITQPAGMQPIRVVLWYRPSDNTYVTHIEATPRHDRPAFFIQGHYGMGRAGAERDFKTRCKDLGVTDCSTIVVQDSTMLKHDKGCNEPRAENSKILSGNRAYMTRKQIEATFKATQQAEINKILPLEYLVKWEIELDADNPQDAAKEALRIQRDVNSTATVFTVTGEGNVETTIDISKGE